MDKWWEEYQNLAAFYTSAAYLRRVPGGNELPANTELGSAAESCLDNEELPAGILLTGPTGSGRHYTAARVAARLMEDGYHTIFVALSDLCPTAEDQSFPLFKQKFDFLFNDNFDNKYPLCLVLESFRDYPFREQLLRYLACFLCEQSLMPPSESNVFLILITDQVEDVPPVMRSLLHTCCLGLPNDTNRASLFLDFGNDLVKLKYDEKTFVTQTEGLNYSELFDILNFSSRMAKQDITEETVQAVRNVFMGARERALRRSQTQRLQIRIEKLLDNLPDLIARIPMVQQPEGKTKNDEEPKKLMTENEVVNTRKEQLTCLNGPQLTKELNLRTVEQIKAEAARRDEQEAVQQTNLY